MRDGATPAATSAADARPTRTAVVLQALGLRSSAAVPIVIDGRQDVALAIYSSEPGRFDAEEVGLLERLAADVGFAIEAAGRERARRKAERLLEVLNADLERRVRERTDELEAANAELEASNAELEAFSYSVRTICARHCVRSTASPRRCSRTTAASSTTRP